ncbi:uncharacterized protein LOC131627663 [Vicia villosa]|uniref:uncharacterized protein LOC131627663 n=1 Tax=Vicia villosa TaxID=3911 RepID=UPI00273B870A|nr:uncharacterized protein LOC131627663 [Vicia villosa]
MSWLIVQKEMVGGESKYNQIGGSDEFCGVGKFQKNNLPVFKERYHPKGAQTWLQEIEKIFRVMACTNAHKYFPADVCSRGEVGLLKLKQGNMNVADYTAKFEELSRFFPRYNGMEAEGSKCVNQCRIYDEDSVAKSVHYKSVSEKNNGNQNRGQSYVTLKDGEIEVSAEDRKWERNKLGKILLLL